MRVDSHVVEAAIEAFNHGICDANAGADRGSLSFRDLARTGMESAIAAADEARAEQGYVLVQRDDVGWILEFAQLIKIPGAKPSPKMVEAYNRIVAALNDGETVPEGEPTP